MKTQHPGAGFRRALPALAAAASLGLCGAALAASKTYTLDADFALGTLSGVNYDAPHSNQLQLNATGTTFPIMWISNAGEDTVSKFDTINNVELARYRTWFGPSGQAGYYNHFNNAYAGAAPSRTAVDLDGNAYVLNRCFNNCGPTNRPVLIKILAEGGIDRNGNGTIETASGATPFAMADSNGNGAIDPSEITDERIAWAVQVGDNNGLGRALCIGTDGNLWVGNFNTQRYYKYSSADGSVLAGPVPTTPTTGKPSVGSWQPYGCLIDQNGTLWSASLYGSLGKIENTASNTGPYPVSSFSNSMYGIGLGNGKVYSGYGNRIFDPTTNTSVGFGGQFTYGIVIDGGGNIVLGYSTVQKLTGTGTPIWTTPLQAGGSPAIGIQVDSNNDVWQIGFASAGRMQKYRGTDGAPLGTFPVGNLPYTYSDAAGFAARNVTTPTGTWTVTYDSGASGTPWGTINWNDLVPQGGGVIVQARSADTEAALPLQSYQPVTKNTQFTATGRYIQIQTRLNANTAGDSPVLYDLTVTSNPQVCNIDGDADVDSNDINLIRAAIGTTPSPNDPRDANGDGLITINDVRACTLVCTKPRCAP